MSNAAILPCPTQDVLGKNPIFRNSNDGGVLVLMALNVSITELLNCNYHCVKPKQTVSAFSIQKQ